MSKKVNNNSKMEERSNPKGKASRQQPRKDSRKRRVNYDNTRVSKFDRDMEESRTRRDSGNPSNHIEWYAANPELLRSAASLPFSTTTGLPLPWGGSGDQKTVPGVMALGWRPSIGGAFIDPINQAANSTYSFVVHANSRSKSYDAPDMMQMILCGASFFSMVAFGIRAYGVMRTYDQRNSYLPKALVAAMGFDFDDLQANLSHMWFDLNEVIARSQQIWIPKNFPFIERWFWMNSNIYIDAESIKAQYYMFVPYQYLVYNATGDFADNDHLANADLKYWTTPQLSYGKYTTGGLTNDSNTWADFMAVLNSMLTPLLRSQDRGIIFGDILKAYGTDNIYALQPISADYQVQPVYEPEVLTQIENLTISTETIESFDQDPKTNQIYESAYTPVTQPVQYGGVPAPSKQVLNFHQTEPPTPEQIMRATRLKAAGMASVPNGKGTAVLGGTTAGGWAPAACGTEVIHYIKIWNALSKPITITPSGEGAPSPYQVPAGEFIGVFWTQIQTGDSVVGGIIDWNMLSKWASFDWAPWVYRVNFSAPWGSAISTAIEPSKMDSGESIVTYAVGDYDYYTIVDVNELKKMHQTAIYSEFGVPTI